MKKIGDLISRSSLDSFFYSETSGTEEVIEDAVMKYPDMEMNYPDDCRALCKDIIEMCRNVIKTEKTAYDVEKVVAELENKESIMKVVDLEEKQLIRLISLDCAIDIVKAGGVE